MESRSKVRGGDTITAAVFKRHNVQVRAPPRKRARAAHPRARHNRVAIAHPSVCGTAHEDAGSVWNRRTLATTAVVYAMHRGPPRACVAGLAAALSVPFFRLLTDLCVRPGTLEDVVNGQGDVTIFVEYGIGLLQYAHCDLVYELVNPVLYIRMYMDSTARHLLAVKLVGG